MAEQHPADVPPQHDNPEVDHEHSDVNVSAVVKFAGGLIAFAVVAHLILAWLFGVLARKTDREQPRLPPIAQEGRLAIEEEVKKQLKKAAANPHSSALPRPPRVFERLQTTIPPPRLQIDDQADLAALRKRDEAQLRATGWVDRKAGIARIPIDEAMRLVSDPQTAARLGIRIRGQHGNGASGKSEQGKGERKGER
jgi:hypothetical protein